MELAYACSTCTHYSSWDILATLGWSGSGPYMKTKMTRNHQGNVLCNFVDLHGREGYQYRNSNGSYFFQDTDGSSYYNNGKGYARYTFPNKAKLLEIFDSSFRRKDFNPRALDFDLFRTEFPELREVEEVDLDIEVEGETKPKIEDPDTLVLSMDAFTLKEEEEEMKPIIDSEVKEGRED